MNEFLNIIKANEHGWTEIKNCTPKDQRLLMSFTFTNERAYLMHQVGDTITLYRSRHTWEKFNASPRLMAKLRKYRPEAKKIGYDHAEVFAVRENFPKEFETIATLKVYGKA